MCSNVVSSNFLWALFGLLLVVLGTGTVDATHPRQNGQTREIRYEHFDDYLMGMSEDLEREERTGQYSPQPQRDSDVVGRLTSLMATSDDEDVVEGSGSQDETPSNQTPPRTNTVSPVNLNILAYFRDVPRQHWSCCMLGVLAGDKGFHCQAQFYAARIVLRNRNRSHNRRLPFHGRNRNPTYGKDIMYHFQGCVERRAAEFHKCCYAATLERLEMDRWRRYRDFVSRARGQ